MPLPTPGRRALQECGINAPEMALCQTLGLVDCFRPHVVPVTRAGYAVSWRPGDRHFCTFETTPDGLCRWSLIWCFPGFNRICMPLAWQAMVLKGPWAALPNLQPMGIWAAQAGYCRRAFGSAAKHLAALLQCAVGAARARPAA
jgi:hypothetical protein